MTRPSILPKAGKLQCSKCAEWKDVESFSPNRHRECGRASSCRICVAAQARDYYRRHREKCVKRTGEWIKQRPEKVKEYAKRHKVNRYRLLLLDRERHPDRWKARKALNNAVRDGKLARLPCEVCGNPKTHGHHHSYEKADWLKVKWLCVKHHREEHQRIDGKEVTP